MDSLQIVKPPVEATVKNNAPSSQPVNAGNSQASEKSSFSEKLAQAQPKSKTDAAADSTKVKESETAETKGTRPSAESSDEAKESGSKKEFPLQGASSFAQQGQELPSETLLIAATLPVTSNIPVEQLLIPQQATAAAATVVVSGLVSNQIKDMSPARPLTGPGSLKSPLNVKTDNVLAEDLISLDKQGLKPVMTAAKDDANATTMNLLKQMQQPLAQKADLIAGIDSDKIVDKAIKLLTGNDSLRSETVSAARAPDSSLNVGLASDPFKIANENLGRTAQAPKINLPLSDSKWGEEFSNRIAWMSKNNIRSAQIKITPAHLGPIEVRVSLQNDQASVSFISNNAVVRDAIESASARLRETFADGGFENLDVDVSSRENMKDQQQDDNESSSAQNNTIEPKEEIADEAALGPHAANDLDWDNSSKMGVDYFA